QQTFNNACRTCHTTKEGDNRLGPNLHNIIGRKAGSLQNYGYSRSADATRSRDTDDCYSAAINRRGRPARQAGRSFQSPGSEPFSSIARPPALCNPSLLHSTAEPPGTDAAEI